MQGGVRVRDVYPLSPPTMQTSSELGVGHSTELESQLSASQRQVKRLEDDLAEQKVGKMVSVVGCVQWVLPCGDMGTSHAKMVLYSCW